MLSLSPGLRLAMVNVIFYICSVTRYSVITPTSQCVTHVWTTMQVAA